GSKEKKEAFEKWFSLCSTTAEAREAFNNAPNSNKEETLKKWKELSAKEIEKASTVAETQEAYGNTPSGSKEEKEALKKIILLS
ncbi:MAG TPA: hypothetical protein PLQ44_01915, partial [Candidatus Paceibacterota bacterium]|nr:hypothetical protein [Candidatus Paceibacterota bacterium]